MFFLVEKEPIQVICQITQAAGVKEPIQVICQITQAAGVKDLKNALLGKFNNGLYWPRNKSLISLNLGF